MTRLVQPQTIITKKFADSGITPTTAIAGFLLAGILSDTLILKMSTTTPEDHKMVAYLAGITGLDPVSFGTKLLERGMNLEGATMEDLLVRDTKRYELFGKKVIISQVMVPSFVYPQAHTDEIQQELARLRVQQGVDVYLGLFTSVIENGSELFASADSNLLTKLELKKQPVRLADMMSRKKDIIPWFGEKLRPV